MSNSNTIKSTKSVLETLKSKVAAVQWTPSGGGAAVALFGKVEIYDLTDLAVAINDLLAFKDRICLVVLDSEDYENIKQGQELHCLQTRRVVLLMADRHWTKAQTALLGDGTKTPGVLEMKDLVLPAVIGLLQDGVMCEPGTGELSAVQAVSAEEKKSRSRSGDHRITYWQPLTLRGGEYFAELGRKSIY